jgi:hypothetical protein
MRIQIFHIFIAILVLIWASYGVSFLIDMFSFTMIEY